jgi:hypothetical protein
MASGAFNIHEIGGGWGWTYVSGGGVALSQSSRIYARPADAVRDAIRSIGAFQAPRRKSPARTSGPPRKPHVPASMTLGVMAHQVP